MSGRLSEQVIGCAVAVSRQLGHGFLERVYEGALAIELKKQKFLMSAKRASPFNTEVGVLANIAVILLSQAAFCLN